MTREEKISKAAYSQYCNSESICFNLMCDSFKQGAKWADNHPKSPWISVKDDLPYNHEDLLCYNKRGTVEVLVRDKYGNVYTNVMRKGADAIWFFAREQRRIVEFWMRIPELPKE